MQAAPLVKQNRRTDDEAPQALRPSTLGGPLEGRSGAPYGLPVPAIAGWTHAHRTAKADAYALRAVALRVLGAAAWDAHGRAELPIAPGLTKEGAELATAPREAAARRFERVDGRLECLTHAERRKVTLERFVDRAGNARQRRVSSRVWVPRHKAYADSAKWHEGRAEGLRAREAHVRACGVGHVEVSCNACGCTHDVPTYCGLVAWCPGCNERRSMRARARFAKSFEAVQEHAELAGSFRANQRGGGLRQKMLTLTVPHLGVEPSTVPIFEGGVQGPRPMNTIAMWHEHARSNAAERRVRVLFEASRHFTKRLQKYLREPWKGEKREIVGACWSRAFEWTLGDDTLGHPHFHLWALEPWIPLEDEHRIESVIDGVRRPTTPCKAQGDAKHAKRAKTCELCAAKVERRTGMRTWWSSGLAQSGVELASENVIIDIREMQAHPMRAFREVRKPLGVNYQGRDEHNPIARAKAYVKSIEMRTAAGEVVNYFENWNMARLDEETLRLAGPSVIGGVARALEGRRMSQASKVVLLKNKREPKGETMRVGFYGIADSYYGGECESCKAAGGERLPSKGVRVVSWQQKVAARVEAHAPTPMPVDTGPPPHDAEAAYRDLVHRLQVAEAGASGVLAKLEDVCAAVRELGADVLPIYRRGRVRKGPIVWTAREKMKHAARVARKNKAG